MQRLFFWILLVALFGIFVFVVAREHGGKRVGAGDVGNGARDVNPATIRAITVSFDRAMETKKHGLHLFEGKQSVDLTRAEFTYSPDGKTFSLSYAFKSSTHYEVQMNSTEDIGFAATNRAPLWPVHFAFTTGQPH